MLNQTLNDAQIVAGIDNLKIKNECPFNLEPYPSDERPLLLTCTQYLAVDDELKWNIFLKYVTQIKLKVDRQFYIDLGKIYEQIFGHCYEEDRIMLESVFGKPEDSYKDNQLQELFFIFSKCSPFNNDARTGRFLKIGAQLQPENLDDRSTVVAVQLFRKFYLQYADYNFKQNNPFHIIKNSNIHPYDTTPVIEKVVNLMMKNNDFLDYIENHTSLFVNIQPYQIVKQEKQKEQLIQFLGNNTDLSHFIITVYDLLNKVTEGEFNSTLILKHISLQVLDPFLHPLALSICDFYEQILEDESDGTEEDRKLKERYLPRITFLNMDGFDYELNSKLLDPYSEQCQYICVLDEMLDSGELSQMFDLVTGDSEFFKQAKNTYVIPIRNNNHQKKLNDMHFRHILDTIIYPLIKQFQPQVIIFSYSFAYFNKESDIQLSSKLFIEITTHLSLISNYKVIFLPRLMSSGIQIQDHRFEKELLNTDHKNIFYYLNIYLGNVQQSYKFLHSSKQLPCKLANYANNSMKIVKSNSFYEKKRVDNHNHYYLNKEKERYMFEILSGFLESCRKSYLQEVKDKDKRMQDPNLQCEDLLKYKLSYAKIMNKLYTIHKQHYYKNVFKITSNQIHTYNLLQTQHQKIQRRENSQFVSFLAQDLKDYVYIVDSINNNQPQFIQIYLRRLSSPIYIHNKLTQYFVNYKLKSILFINVLSFVDLRDIEIDSYQVCLVNYEKYLNSTQLTEQIWAEIKVIHETIEPIFFRSLCFDKIKNNIYCIYGKEAKFNTLSDSIDTFNFDKNTFTKMQRDKTTKKDSDKYFPRAYASSVVFSFDQQIKSYTEVWTFGGSFLGHYNQEFQNMGFCNLVERIFIHDDTYRSEKINKEFIFPLSMRPMYGSLMLNIQDNDESAILIIGGSQNELLVNIDQQEHIGYKFQQIDNQYYVSYILNIGNKINPISFYSLNQNIYSYNDRIYILNDSTQILGKPYKSINGTDDFVLSDPYSPYGFLSVTSLKISYGQTQQEMIQKRKLSIKQMFIEATNTIIHGNQVIQPFAQMHKNMKFYYKEIDSFYSQTRIIFQDNNEIVGVLNNFEFIKYIYLNVNIKDDENNQQGYLKPCSMCVSYLTKCLYILTTNIENGSVYYTIYSYSIDQLLQDINLSLNLNKTKLVINVYTIFSKVDMHLTNNIEQIVKHITCDDEALYLVGGYMKLIYQEKDLNQILFGSQQSFKYHENIENEKNFNFKIPFDNQDQYSKYSGYNKYMYKSPYIIWTNQGQILIIEKYFKQKYFTEVIDKIQHDFKIWMTKFEILTNEQWEQGILVLPSFLLKNSYVEMSSQTKTKLLTEQIQHRKLDLFLQNSNSEFETIVKIVDYLTIDSTIILTCAVQIINYIQMMSLEFSIENQEDYLFEYKFNGSHQQHHQARRNSVPIFIPKITLLMTTQKQTMLEGYQIYEPVNEYQTIRQNQSQIIVKLKEQIKQYNLIPQN